MILKELNRESNLIELRTAVQLCTDDEFVIISSQTKAFDAASCSASKDKSSAPDEGSVSAAPGSGQKFRGLSKNGRKWQVSPILPLISL